MRSFRTGDVSSPAGDAPSPNGGTFGLELKADRLSRRRDTKNRATAADGDIGFHLYM